MWKFHSGFTIKVYFLYILQVLAWFYPNTVLPCMATDVEIFHLDVQIWHTLAMKFINVSIAFIVIFLYIVSNIYYKWKLLKILEIIWINTQTCTEAFYWQPNTSLANARACVQYEDVGVVHRSTLDAFLHHQQCRPTTLIYK